MGKLGKIEESLEEKIARISGIPLAELKQQADRVDLEEISQNTVENYSECVEKSISTKIEALEFTQGRFTSYEGEIDKEGHIHAIKFKIGDAGEFKIYISNYTVDERIISARRGVHPQQRVININSLYLNKMQKKTKEGYEATKHKNYYKKFLWETGELNSFIKRVLSNYHREKLA